MSRRTAFASFAFASLSLASAPAFGQFPANAPPPQAPPPAPPPTPPPEPAVEPDTPRPSVEPTLQSDLTPIQRMSFDGAVKAALAKNPTNLIAQQEIRRYHALMEQVRAASLPKLTAGGVYTRLDQDRVANGVVYEPIGVLEGTLTLSAPLIHPQSWVLWSEAADLEDVAKANALDVRRTIAVATGRAYLTILTQRRLVDTARTARDNAKAHYEFTRAQRIGGVGNRLDEVRAAQEYTSDEVNLQQAHVSLERAREALGVFVAGDEPVDAAEDWNPGGMPTFNDAVDETQTLRPDVKARDRATRAADRTVNNAWADYMPYLDLIAYPFLATPSTVTLPSNGWEAQLVLNLPLYDGGLRYGQEHERKAVAAEARLNEEDTLRQARSDVRVAFEEIQRADIALDQARQSAAFAKRALELADIAYRAGATTNLEVIDAERQARDAEDQAAIAEDAARQARLDLLAASGRFP